MYHDGMFNATYVSNAWIALSSPPNAPDPATSSQSRRDCPRTFQNNHEMLEHRMVMYDALYTWCRSLQTKTHNWPPATAQQARRG